MYFITVNGQLIDSRDDSGPDATVIQEAIQTCDCVASRERFVDVKGTILSPQIPAIEKALSTAWRSRIKGT